MLTDSVKTQLKKEFGSMKNPVILSFRKDNSKLSEKIAKFLSELSKLSNKILINNDELNLSCHGDPCIVITKKNSKPRIRFMAVPEEGVFKAFIKTITMISNDKHDLSKRTIGFLNDLNQKIEIKVFITKNCGWCPPTMLKMFSFSVYSQYIETTAIDCYTFPEIAQKYNVVGVPKVIINDKVEFVGFKEENEVLGHIFGAIN